MHTRAVFRYHEVYQGDLKPGDLFIDTDLSAEAAQALSGDDWFSNVVPAMVWTGMPSLDTHGEPAPEGTRGAPVLRVEVTTEEVDDETWERKTKEGREAFVAQVRRRMSPITIVDSTTPRLPNLRG